MGEASEREALTLVEQALDAASPSDFVLRHASGPVVRDRALALLSRQASTALRTGEFADLDDPPPAPERVGAYRITGLIGQGGMGAVYRGERATGDFDHRVAIKLVRPGALGDELIERFARERQTLARLAHPNIARLFDGGTTPEGQPYIVMELVDGVPLDRWLATDPPTAARLDLFLAICHAVGFAHRNLVVHRDLTPPNVLVTSDDVPKLIDFGIARPLGAEGARDRAETATPGFAAPERLRPGGEAATSGDIYALGRLLDRLFPPPQARDLAAIVARATAEDPDDRYPTADALAADVRAWRDRRPVAARRGGRGYVWRRFVDRNRWSVGLGMAALTLLITAFAATLLANARAEVARADAERRFAQTRAIARTLLFDVFDQVSRVPGSTRARATVARAGLQYLNTLAADPGAPFAVRVEAGQGFARLADVIGSGATSGLGRMADGDKLLDRAETILTATHRERPDDSAARRALAAMLIERSRAALFNDNDVPRARRAAAQASRLIGPERARDAEGARIQAAALLAEGEALSWEDSWPAAERAYGRAERFLAALPAPLAAAPAVRRVRAHNQRLLAEAHHKQNDEAAAGRAIARAIMMDEALLAADPADPRKRRAVVAAYRYSAVLYRANDRLEPANRAIARAVAVARASRDADPADEAAALLWLLAAEVQAQTLADARLRDETFALGEAMRREYRRLLPVAGDTAGMHRHFASALRTIGGNYYNLGAFDRACGAWREASAQHGWLSQRAELTETDRRRVADIGDYLARACDGGVPRQGLGPEL